MLSTLPKLADSRFVLGYFLPSLLFVLAMIWLWCDTPLAQINMMLGDKPTTGLLYLVGVWVFGVLLRAVNDPLYRLFTGQTWPLAAWRCGLERNSRQMAELRRRLQFLFDVRQRNALTAELRAEYLDVRRELFLSFPRRENRVLSTRFGNTMRAALDYSNAVYGADAPTIWSRLISVIPTRFSAEIDDARCQIDLFMNSCTLALVALLMGIGRLCGYVHIAFPHSAADPLLTFSDFKWSPAIFVLAAAVVARLTYLGAVEQMRAWGELVRAAFDLYLPALATALGFRLPPTRETKLRFWRAFAMTGAYGIHPNGDVDFDPDRWMAAPLK